MFLNVPLILSLPPVCTSTVWSQSRTCKGVQGKIVNVFVLIVSSYWWAIFGSFSVSWLLQSFLFNLMYKMSSTSMQLPVCYSALWARKLLMSFIVANIIGSFLFRVYFRNHSLVAILADTVLLVMEWYSPPTHVRRTRYFIQKATFTCQSMNWIV